MNQIKEIYEYREMIISLVRKDLRGRYKGSVLGFFWTFLNPLLQLVVFTLVFSIIMKQEYEQYYIFLFVALVPWMFFASSVQDGSTSVLRDKEMVKKIYFPREVLPIATVTSGFVNMLLTFLVIFVVLIFSGRGVNPVALLCLPVVMIVEYILCLGVGLIVASVTVYLRDLQYILGIIVMALQYLTPVKWKRLQTRQIPSLGAGLRMYRRVQNLFSHSLARAGDLRCQYRRPRFCKCRQQRPVDRS